ncbi:MAG: hypothetical protein OXB88_04035 [Bacteriovoracales bacterium]|nr:hypothetical protein [Bacteriovoracales bacterium]
MKKVKRLFVVVLSLVISPSLFSSQEEKGTQNSDLDDGAVLHKIGTQSFSYNKEGGHSLGLYTTKRNVESCRIAYGEVKMHFKIAHLIEEFCVKSMPFCAGASFLIDQRLNDIFGLFCVLSGNVNPCRKNTSYFGARSTSNHIRNILVF